MMTRAERKAHNRRVHAIRRMCTDADYKSRPDGDATTWRAIWDTYAGMADELVLTLEHTAPTAPAAKVTPAARAAKPKRTAPAHIAALSAEYRLAREAWEAGLEEAMAGGRRNGRPARGEKYTDEERDYRDAHPAPVWRDFLARQNASSAAAA